MITQTTSNTLKTLRHWLLVCWLLIALPTAAAADELVGRVVSAVGEVIAIRPDEGELALQRRSEIYIGDTLVTGENGRAQIRFVDDGLVDLRPNSELLVENYSEPTAEDSGSAVLEFSRGALRTVSGTIGQNPDDEYRMETTAASIGIRGTDYALQYCDAACVDAGGAGGLYGRINDGGITVTNLAGTQDFDSGQFFNVVDQNTLPTPVPRPPAGILDGNEGGENGEDDDEDEIEEIGLDEPDDDEDGDEDDAPDLVSQSVDPVSASSTVSVDESGLNITRAMVGIFSYIGYGGYGDNIPPAHFGGLIRQQENSETSGFTLGRELDRDRDDRIYQARFGDETSVNVLGEPTVYGGWVDWEGDAEVYWGYWETPNMEAQLEGNEVHGPDFERDENPRFYFGYSEDLTTPSQLSALRGTVTFRHTENWPYAAITATEGTLDLNSIETEVSLTVDFSNLQAALDMEIEALSQGFDSHYLYEVSTGMTEVDSLFLFEVPFDGSWTETSGIVVGEGTLVGEFNGQFVGETADGGLFAFTLDQLNENGDLIEHLIGAGFLVDESLLPH